MKRGLYGLRVENVFAGYRQDADILHGVSLRVDEGSFVSIIGPNGAGKSTILNAVFGAVKTRAGGIYFGERNVSEMSPRSRLLEGISLLPQGHNLFPEMSVSDNLELGGYLISSKKELALRLAEVYERFPLLWELRKKTAGYLSGGQMQLVEIGRALLLRPKLVLIDEPSLGLSPKVSREVFECITELRGAGVSVLMVEQNAAASLELSDYAYIVAGGQTVREGVAADIGSDPGVREAYLGGS